MNLDDLLISEYFDSSIMPYGMKITHIPTGLSVMGNCKHEQSKLNLQRTLTDTLGLFVTEAESKDASLKRKSAMEVQNEQLKAQLAEMKANIERLMEQAGRDSQVVRQRPHKAPSVGSTPTPATKSKRGWSPEQRAAAAQRMKDRQAARYGLKKPEQKVDTPAGEKTEEELIREQMRTPNQRPQRLPKAHESHGGTVVQVSPEAQARGFKP